MSNFVTFTRGNRQFAVMNFAFLFHFHLTFTLGLFARQRCPKGTLCNFLHVFPNPKNFLTAADKDLHRTPTDEMEIDEREIDGRNWRWSESPERLPVVQSDRKSKHSRSRSREHHMTKRHARKPHRSSNRDHERRYKSSTSVK
uniref:C3H1-type domain-containing protein n=1 Tax=Photinus pyralis TaxID=7054 RepID=A0A1Y1K7Y8_PHOPY